MSAPKSHSHRSLSLVTETGLPWLLLLLSLLLPLLGAAPAKVWELLYEEDGISVYGDDGQPRSYRAEGRLSVGILELLAVLADVKRRPQWVKSLAEARIVSGNPEEDVLIYSRYDFPWPAADRDVLVRSLIAKDFDKGEVTVSFKAVSDAQVPPVDGLVRIAVADGTFVLKDDGGDHTQVRYEITTDPGGMIPDWITRYFTKTVPLKTLKALEAQVGLTRKDYREFLDRVRPLWKRPAKG